MSLQWIVIRQAGCAWAVPGARVRRIRAGGEGFALDLDNHELRADAVLATPAVLPVKAVGPLLRSWVPSGCAGLAVWCEEPVLVADPDNPPPVLIAENARETGSEEIAHDE